MAVTRLTLVRTRAGRKPQNVDLNTVKQMTDIWSGDEDAITEAFGEFVDGDDYSQEGLSDGISYADRGSAQKVAQAYKGYLEKHFPNMFSKATEPIKLAAVTGKNPEGEGFVFSLNPEPDTDSTSVTVVETDDADETEDEDTEAETA